MVQRYFGFGLCLAFIFVGTCSGQKRGGVERDVAEPSIMKILSKANISGSLEFWGSCDNESGVPDYPRLSVPSNNNGTPLEILREMFSADPEMQVTQDADGTIRMVESDVPRDFLAVTIGHISFDGIRKTIYESDGRERTEPFIVQDPNDALHLILATPEVGAFMKSQNIKRPYLFDSPSSHWPGEPQISGSLENTTLSQALDYVLKVYPGFWVYENCTNKSKERMVYIGFTFDSLGWAAKAKHH